MKVRKILFMWISLKLMTGLGAGLGAIALQRAAPMIFALIQGIVAGAMLTVIAETMPPETFLKGADIVGLSTLLGFLAAIFFSTLGRS